MKLTTVLHDNRTQAGRVHGESVTLLPYDDVGELLASGSDWRQRASVEGSVRISAADAQLVSLVPRPEKVVCVGVNYRDHCEEVGIAPPDHPTLFAKYHRSLIGPYDDIALPAASDSVDWEAELGVVIGDFVRNATPEQAAAAIGGYTIVNDISMRDWQLRTSQFLAGKTFEASTPVGPFLVTPDDVDDARSLRIECLVNDEVMQDADTSKMVFGVPEIVSYISQIITLAPGDVIATGTPSGVGGARKPPRYLAPGDNVVTRIEGLGELSNRCVEAR